VAEKKKKKKGGIGDVLLGEMKVEPDEDEITKEVPVPVSAEEPKVMAEPPKPLAEPEKPAPKEPAKKLVASPTAPGVKKMLDHNPTMLRKHHSIMNQKAPSSRKYFQSR